MAEEAARYRADARRQGHAGWERDEAPSVAAGARGLALLRRNRAAQLSLAFLALVVLAALFAPWLAPARSHAAGEQREPAPASGRATRPTCWARTSRAATC